MNTNNRIKKVSRLIQKELSNVFNIDMKNIFSEVLISITTVRITPDFSQAKVFISVFPIKDPKDFILAVNAKKAIIRGKLGNRIKSQLRKVPDIRFLLDDSSEFSSEIERLIKK